MAMWVNLARVTPEAFERIRRDPHLLGPLFMEQDDEVLAMLGVAPEDISGLDYDSAEDMIDAQADLDRDREAPGDDDDDADDVGADEPTAVDGDDAEHGGGDEADEEDDDDGDDVGDHDAAAAPDDDDEERGDVVLVDLRIAGTLGYDAGFGSAFFLTPAAAKQAAESSVALALDDEAKAIVQAAGERGHYIVGVVN